MRGVRHLRERRGHRSHSCERLSRSLAAYTPPMVRQPARLQIDPAPAKAVGTAVRILSGWIGVEHLRLGLAVAHTLAPGHDFAYAWSTMTGDMKRGALTAYRDLAEGGSHPRFRGLENARHGGIAADLWNEVLRMFETDLQYVPPLGQGDDDTGHCGGGHGR